MWISSGSSTSGKTSTPVVDVWIRPCDSVAGTRWTRCTPPSYFRWAHTPCAGSLEEPLMATWTSLNPPRSDSLRSSSSVFHPFEAAYCRYIRSRSAANRALSAPPSPCLISMITSRASSGSRGIRSRRSRSWVSARRSSRAGTSSAKASSSRARSRAATRSSDAATHASWAATIRLNSAYRLLTRFARAGSACTAGSDSSICTSRCSSISARTESNIAGSAISMPPGQRMLFSCP